MHRLILLLVFLFSGFVFAFSQSPLAHFSMNQCAYNDTESRLSNIQLVGAPDCVCGPVEDAVSIPNPADYLLLDSTFGQVMSSDFSMSFYINIGDFQGQQLVDIMSNERVCFGDSSYVLQFDPVDNSLNMFFIVAASNRVKLSCQLDMNQCWHHIAVTRNRVFFTLYYNGEEVDNDTYDKGVNIFISDKRKFSIGNSVCSGQKFNGAIDELKLFTNQLSPNEVAALYNPVDKILTQDTVLILGNSIVPNIANSCATSYRWSPDDGSISDVNVSTPDLEPLENIQYTLTFNQNGCIARDTMNVVVVDPNDVHCDKLFLPTAFTPNGDGINDVFGISNAYIIDEIVSFDIFDKWGGVVFSATDIDQKWDGNYKNRQLNSGVFIYKIIYTCNGEEYFKKGSFSILR